jgi:glucose-6-phosphate-specific signal transduction histidine kinase
MPCGTISHQTMSARHRLISISYTSLLPCHRINEETLSDIASGKTAGIGLRGMRERVRQLGGNVEVRSNGKGTTVVATLPFIESPADR